MKAKKVFQFLNEKFKEDSDPIKDMGIGYNLLQQIQKDDAIYDQFMEDLDEVIYKNDNIIQLLGEPDYWTETIITTNEKQEFILNHYGDIDEDDDVNISYGWTLTIDLVKNKLNIRVNAESADIMVPSGGYMQEWSDSSIILEDIQKPYDFEELIQIIMRGVESLPEVIYGLADEAKRRNIEYCESCGSPEDKCEKCEECKECVNDCECEQYDEDDE